MRPTSLLGVLLLAGALSPLAPLTAASAAPADCTPLLQGVGVDLTDANGAVWDLEAEGSINDGTLLGAIPAEDRTDAYDGFTHFSVDDGVNGRETYGNPAATCTFELDDRQVSFPVFTTAGGLELSRKVYVPASGPGFARFYNQVHNPTASATTISLFTADGDQGDLGSDDDTTLRDDSSAGPAPVFVSNLLDTAVSWFSTSDTELVADSDPVLSHNLDGAFSQGGSGVRDRVDRIEAENGDLDSLSFEYQNVTVPAGGTVAYISFEAMRRTSEEASTAGRYIDAQPDGLFAGMTAVEKSVTQNWGIPDADGDGVANTVDNCDFVVNSNQADLDKDGIGDACDSDTDGDGISNELETAFGLNPAKADTDGDGVADKADNCPKVAGATADGCTVPTIVVNNVRGASATKVKGKMNKTGKVTIKAKGSVAATGTPGARDCTNGLVMVVVKVGKVAAADKIVRLRSDCTFRYKVKLDQKRSMVKKVSVLARFLGSDGILPSSKRDKI